MKLSTETGELMKLKEDRKAVEITAKAGFDCMDFTFWTWVPVKDHPLWDSDWRTRIRNLRKYADDNGVFYNQAHAPFRFNKEYLPDFTKEVFPLLERTFEACAILGVPKVVVHPFHFAPYLSNKDYLYSVNMEMFQKLAPLAAAHDVKISLENMFDFDSVSNSFGPSMFSDPYVYRDFYDKLGNRDVFTCCVDTGHCNLTWQKPEDMIRILGDRVSVLHINDNRMRGDDHILPYTGLTQWDPVLQALAETGYEGEFTFEVLRLYDSSFDDDMLLTSARYLCDTGRHMIRRLESFRKQ